LPCKIGYETTGRENSHIHIHSFLLLKETADAIGDKWKEIESTLDCDPINLPEAFSHSNSEEAEEMLPDFYKL